MDKQEYAALEMEVIEFGTEDVITTSNGINMPPDWTQG